MWHVAPVQRGAIEPPMPAKKIIMSINASWNIVNFRAGLIRALQESGIDVVAVAPEDQWSAALAPLGVSYVPIAMDKSGASPTRDLQLLRDYGRILREVRPDAFLGFTAKPNIYGSLAAHRLSIPVLNNISGLGTAFIKQSWLTPVVSNLYRFALRKSHTIFFQNPDDRDLFVEKELVPAQRTRLLPGSGIDLDEYMPGAASSDTAPTFLLVARMLWDKGVGEFVEAARLIKREHPSVRFQLLGFADADNRTAVSREQIDAWVAEGLVQYLGATDDVRPFLGSADCVVLPSYREGLPRSLLEAAAMGKPLIATDVPGCREIVSDGENGFLCTARDPSSLAAAIRKLLALPAGARAAMGAKSRQMVEDRYDEKFVHRLYLDALQAATAVRP